MFKQEVHVDPTEVKTYKVTPARNRFVPDILPFGRIEEPGFYDLNIREVRRAMNYGYVVEEAQVDELFFVGLANIGKAGIVGPDTEVNG